MPRLPEAHVGFKIVALPAEHKSVVALPAWVTGQDGLQLVYPLAADFMDYDIFLFSDHRLLAGWQCKTTRGYPDNPAPIPGASWVMNGSAPARPKRRDDGWVVADEASMRAFLGSSLALAVPRLWETVTVNPLVRN